jgi:ribosomal protein S18 acetylase RimI-like enzyme
VDGVSDADLYRRGAQTLVASWQEYARGASGAAVRRLPGVVVAIFPDGPERLFYNNALIERDLTAAGRSGALDALETAYAAAGVTRFAAWVHESDYRMREAVEARGYTLEESTRAMAIALDGLTVPEPDIELAPAAWSQYVRFLETFAGVPSGLLAGTDPSAFHVLLAGSGRQDVAAAIAIDVDGDCGIYNVATIERARRRGLGTALTALHLHEARRRGCHTATLQSTAMAERLYAGIGFRDLGRILEYTPSGAVKIGPVGRGRHLCV